MGKLGGLVVVAGLALGARHIIKKQNEKKAKEFKRTQRELEDLKEEARENQKLVRELAAAKKELESKPEPPPIEAFETLAQCPACGAPGMGTRCVYCGTDLRTSNMRAYENRQAQIEQDNSQKDKKESSYLDNGNKGPQNNKVSRTQQKKKGVAKVLVILFALIVIAVISIIYFVNKTTDNAISFSRLNVIQESEHSIAKGAQYAYMSDEWNVYVATAISDSLIKIENWDKKLSTSKRVNYRADIGIYQINDEANAFGWLNDEHTAFTIIFADKNNGRVRRPAHHIFTINTGNGNENKGTNYDKRIACYKYVCDDWHMYRAISLSDKLIKIECWYRSFAFGNHLYGWDWCIIDTSDNSVGFHWTDEEHTSFTMTTHDPQNSFYWGSDTFVVFELENKDYSYPSVYDFLNK